MADVFISYSQLDRQLAEKLAGFLTDHDYEVWWDTELVGGERFREKILEQLTAARSAVVIWTPASVKSVWVVDECERAQREGKLITTRIDGLNVNAIPLGFGGQLAIPVEPLEGTLKALSKLGVKPSRPPKPDVTEQPLSVAELKAQGFGSSDIIALEHWNFVKNSKNPKDYEKFLGEFGDTKLAPLARKQLDKLGEDEWQARSDDVAWYTEFLQSFSSHRHVKDAKARIDMLKGEAAEAESWAAIEHGSDVEPVATHIAKFPGGAHIAAAHSKLQTLERERNAERHWRAITGATRPEPFDEFLRLYPDSIYSEEARTQLAGVYRAQEESDWHKISQERHPAPFLHFLNAHPNGARAAEAFEAIVSLPRLIEEEAWNEAKDSRVPVVLQAYQEALPRSRYAKAASMRLRTLSGGTISDRPRSGAPNVGATAKPSTAEPSAVRSKQGKRVLFWIVTVLIFLAGVAFSANAIANPYYNSSLEGFITAAAICVAAMAMMFRLFGPALYPPRNKSRSWQALLFHAFGSVGTLAWLTLSDAAYALLNYYPPPFAYNLTFMLLVSIVAIVTLRKLWWLRFVYYGLLFAIGCWSAVHYSEYSNGSLRINFEVAFGAVLVLLSGSGLLFDLNELSQSRAEPAPPPVPR